MRLAVCIMPFAPSLLNSHARLLCLRTVQYTGSWSQKLHPPISCLCTTSFISLYLLWLWEYSFLFLHFERILRTQKSSSGLSLLLTFVVFTCATMLCNSSFLIFDICCSLNMVSPNKKLVLRCILLQSSSIRRWGLVE